MAGILPMLTQNERRFCEKTVFYPRASGHGASCCHVCSSPETDKRCCRGCRAVVVGRHLGGGTGQCRAARTERFLFRMKRFISSLAMATAVLLSAAGATGEPHWWGRSAATGVSIWDGSPANTENFAPINVGQLKHVAHVGALFLDAAFESIGNEDGAGERIRNMVADPAWRQGGDFHPVAVGQLKRVAAEFYLRLHQLDPAAADAAVRALLAAAGRDGAEPLRIADPAAPDSPGTGSGAFPVPWQVSDAGQHSAPANIGQLKFLFSFEPLQLHSFQGDTDNDGLTNRQEVVLGTSPRDEDTDGDGAVDSDEVLDLTDPRTSLSQPYSLQYVSKWVEVSSTIWNSPDWSYWESVKRLANPDATGALQLEVLSGETWNENDLQPFPIPFQDLDDPLDGVGLPLQCPLGAPRVPFRVSHANAGFGDGFQSTVAFGSSLATEVAGSGGLLVPVWEDEKNVLEHRRFWLNGSAGPVGHSVPVIVRKDAMESAWDAAAHPAADTSFSSFSFHFEPGATQSSNYFDANPSFLWPQPENADIGGGYFQAVRWRFFRPDLSVDSDNDDGFLPPDGSEREDCIESDQGADVLAGAVSYTASAPGKVAHLNTGDSDGDGIPDYADGLVDRFQSEGLGNAASRTGEGGGPIVTGSEHFVPMVITVPTDCTFRLAYRAVDPAHMVRTVSPTSPYPVYRPFDPLLPNAPAAYSDGRGLMRLWRKAASEFRSIAPVNAAEDPGDFIPDRGTLVADDLGENAPGADVAKITVYAEFIRASAEIGDLEVLLEIQDPKTNQWIATDEVAFSAVGMALRAVDTDGKLKNPEAASMALSAPSPIVTISQLNVTPNSDGTTSVIIQGSVRSDLCDTIKGAKGVVDRVNINVNGGSEPVAVLKLNEGLTWTKGENPGSLRKPYPYEGTFYHAFTTVLPEGNNIITASAVNPVYGLEGHADHHVRIDLPDEPFLPGETGGPPAPPAGTAPYAATLSHTIVTSLSLGAQAHSPTVVDTLTLQMQAIPGGNLIPATVLNETGVATDSFTSPSSTVRVEIVRAPGIPGSIGNRFIVAKVVLDEFTEVVSVMGETSSGNGVPTNVFESIVRSYRFTEAGPPIAVDAGAVVFQTNGGEFHPFVWEALGPRELLESSEGTIVVPQEVQASSGLIAGLASAGFSVNIVQAQIEQEEFELLAALNESQAEVVTFRTAGDENFAGSSDTSVAALRARAAASVGGTFPSDKWEFGRGIKDGILQAGQEMVGGAWGTVKLGVKAVAYGAEVAAYVQTAGVRVLWKWWQGGDPAAATIGVFADFPKPDPEVEQYVKGLVQMAELGAGLVEAVLTMDFDKLAALGGVFREMFLMSPELYDAMLGEWSNKPSYDKGLLVGRATAEIGAMFMPWAKVARGVGKLSKADFLTELPKKSKFFAAGGRASNAMQRVVNDGLGAALKTTKACFPAGTPVLTREGLRPIESLRVGDHVLARSEDGVRQAWRPVVDTIVTHPDTLYHLRIRVETRGERFVHRARDGVDGGDAEPPVLAGSCPGTEETIVTTGNHPFYVLSRPQPGFFAADELVPGDLLSLADGGTAVLANTRTEHAAPGRRFRTYNLEVAEHHTYFVGRESVWVHNNSKAACERAVSLYIKVLSKAEHNGDPWKALKDFDDSWAAMQKKLGPGAGTEDIRLRVYNEARKKHLANNSGPGPWQNLTGQDLTGTAGMSNAQRAAKLEANMQKAGVPTKAPGFAQHHIVPHKDDIGGHFSRARRVLEDNDIHLDEAANGVSIPKNVATSKGYDREMGVPNSRIHNGDYAEALANRLEDAEVAGRDLRDELQLIAQDLADPQSAWPPGKVRW